MNTFVSAYTMTYCKINCNPNCEMRDDLLNHFTKEYGQHHGAYLNLKDRKGTLACPNFNEFLRSQAHLLEEEREHKRKQKEQEKHAAVSDFEAETELAGKYMPIWGKTVRMAFCEHGCEEKDNCETREEFISGSQKKYKK